MGHRCNYNASLVSTKNNIYIKITANYKDKSAYVYKEDLKGDSWCRYLYYTSIAGYIVVFPGEKLNYYYGGGNQPKLELYSCYPVELGAMWTTRTDDLEKLNKTHPELKYFIKKQNISNIYTFIRVLRVYLKHKEIEPLLELGLNRIIQDKRLYKLTENKRKQIIRYIADNKSDLYDETSLTDIFYKINGVKKSTKYSGITDYNPNERKIGCYKIFIPNDMRICEKQAEVLNQCILRCSYVEDMAKRKTILIFMTLDDGTPIATCQIDKTKTIKQFYANEKDRDNCLPTKTMKQAMTRYINGLDMSNLYAVSV